MSKKKRCKCVECTCTGCHEECFGQCRGCGQPVQDCNSYQTEGEKYIGYVQALQKGGCAE